MRFRISALIACIALAATFILFSTNNVGGIDSDIEIDAESTIYGSETSQTIISDETTKPIDIEQTPEVEEVTTSKEETTYESVTEKTESEDKEEDNQTQSIDISKEEADLMIRIGMCEAGGENIECIASVMRVVLNRVESDVFPDSIHDVLYQKNQFTPVQTGWINTVKPSDKCYEALDMVLNGWDESQGALYFESCSGDSWHSRNLEYLYSYDNMRFYK